MWWLNAEFLYREADIYVQITILLNKYIIFNISDQNLYLINNE